MKKLLILLTVVMLNACTTKYVLMDENGNRIDGDYYTQNAEENIVVAEVDANSNALLEENISANDVFVVSEGADFVTYQYKSVRVDEISPLASLYCADISSGASPYLREVSMYHNGFMRATFDCVHVAI
ncbi:MAG: hypothetical protein J6W96_00655 [Alphaproteobacteria bacterium]|nr:hypothetical protein [Alphaproteobacteria bacterium]